MLTSSSSSFSSFSLSLKKSDDDMYVTQSLIGFFDSHLISCAHSNQSISDWNVSVFGGNILMMAQTSYAAGIQMY